MLKKSLFNKGLFKSNLSRFKWGSFLYFVMLFLSTSFILLMQDIPLAPAEVEYYLNNDGRLFAPGFFIFPALLACTVPTVVAVLIFRYLATKKQGIFIGSLPYTKEANFISSVLSGFALMAAPVLLNGAVLALISISPFGEAFTLWHCAKWVLANLALQFVFFSLAVLSAVITGNSFALIFVNGVLHSFLLILAVGAYFVSDMFLYGFGKSENFILTVLKVTPAAWMLDITDAANIYEKLSKPAACLIFCIAALAVYAISLFAHNKRKIENNENVAGFEFLQPVLKYGVTLFGSILTFAALKGIYGAKGSGLFILFWVILVSLITYFAAEMFLKKSLKIFSSSYKGFIGYAATVFVIVLFVSQTSFFGYENRVPSPNDIEACSLYSPYKDSSAEIKGDEELSKAVLEMHKDIIKNKPKISPEKNGSGDPIYINYRLKGGKTLSREYYLGFEKSFDYLKKMYSYDSYKKASDVFGEYSPENIVEISVSLNAANLTGGNESITDKKLIKEFISAWEADIMALSYEERYNIGQNGRAADDSVKSFDVIVTAKNDISEASPFKVGEEERFSYFNVAYNTNFKNVLSFIKQNFSLKDFLSTDMEIYMSKKPYTVELKGDGENGERYYYNGIEYGSFSLEKNEISKLDSIDTETLLSKMIFDGLKSDVGECYLFFGVNKADERYGFETVTPYQIILKLGKDKLDYLAGYAE